MTTAALNGKISDQSDPQLPGVTDMGRKKTAPDDTTIAPPEPTDDNAAEAPPQGKPPKKMQVIRDILSQEPDLTGEALAAKARAWGIEIDAKTAAVYRSKIRNANAAPPHASAPTAAGIKAAQHSPAGLLMAAADLATRAGGIDEAIKILETIQMISHLSGNSGKRK